MRRMVCLVGVAAVLGFLAPGLAQSPRPAAPAAAKPPSTPPAATAPGGAAGALKRIEALLTVPNPPATLEEYIATLQRQVPEVLKVLDEMERKYPDTPELNQARMIAMTGAVQFSRATRDPVMTARVRSIARSVLASKASTEDRMYADAHLLLLRVRPPDSTSSRPAPDAAQAILDFTKRYAGLSEGAKAIEIGMDVADVVGNNELVKMLLEQLVRDYPRHPLTRMVLRKRGQSPDVGKPFQATLTRLDKRKLTLPDDLLGKVVVIDFWASWCGPCVDAMPEMVKLYAAYKPKGVEFVGVSLDNDRQHAEEFVKSAGMTWIITFSGLAWEDPTARQYGIGGIPSVWVVGKDGKVITDDAGGRLADVLNQALAGKPARPPATAPAGAIPKTPPPAKTGR